MTVGLDVGTSAVKCVAMRHTRNGWLLDAMRIEPLDRGAIDERKIVGVASVGHAVSRSVQALEQPLVITVAGSKDIAKTHSIPLMTDVELAECIRWEVEHVIPYDLDDVVFGYHVQSRDNGNGRMEVLIYSADKQSYADYSGAAHNHGLSVSAAVPSLLASAAWYIEQHPNTNAALIDVGASCTTMVAIRDDRVVMVRRLEQGGDAFTVRLSDTLALSRDEAEALKCEGSSPERAAEPYRAQDRTHLVRRELQTVTDELATDILRFLDFLEATSEPRSETSRSVATVDSIALVGGGARTPGFEDALARRTGLETTLWDPTDGIDVSPSVDAEALRRDRYRLAGALGAACGRLDGFVVVQPRRGLWSRLVNALNRHV